MQQPSIAHFIVCPGKYITNMSIVLDHNGHDIASHHLKPQKRMSLAITILAMQQS